MEKKSLHLIINPNSGWHRAPAIITKFSKRLFDAGFTLHAHMTMCVDHARETINQLPLSENCMIAAVGGDGTVTETIDALMKRPQGTVAPLAVIPAGNGNDFAQALNIRSPKEAIQRIISGHTREMDVLQFTLDDKVRYGIIATMWGYLANAALISENLRGWGPLRYTLSGLIEFCKHRASHLKVTADGEVIDADFDLLLATNTPYFARHVLVAPQAQMDDGLVDLIMLRKQNRKTLLKNLLRLRMNAFHTGNNVEHRAVRCLQIEPQSAQSYSLDARWVESGPLKIDVLQKAIRVVC